MSRNTINNDVKGAFREVVLSKNRTPNGAIINTNGESRASNILDGTDKTYQNPNERLAAAMAAMGEGRTKITMNDINAQLVKMEKKPFSAKESKEIDEAANKFRSPQKAPMLQGGPAQNGKPTQTDGPKPKSGPSASIRLENAAKQFYTSNEPAASEYGGGFLPEASGRGPKPNGRTA